MACRAPARRAVIPSSAISWRTASPPDQDGCIPASVFSDVISDSTVGKRLSSEQVIPS